MKLVFGNQKQINAIVMVAKGIKRTWMSEDESIYAPMQFLLQDLEGFFFLFFVNLF